MNKIKLIYTLSTLGVLTTSAPCVITSCSCASDNNISTIVEDINTVFGKNPKETKLSSESVTDKNGALKKYANILDDVAKDKEIVFSCFNFISKKDLTLNGKSAVPSGKSFYDLYKSGSVQINTQYVINTASIVNNEKFKFQMQGWLTCLYKSEQGSFKANDYVQFVFDMSAYVITSFVTSEEDGKIYMGVKYDFDYSSTGLDQTFGFIKYKLSNVDYPTLSISQMADINFSVAEENETLAPEFYCYNRGYYEKAE